MVGWASLACFMDPKAQAQPLSRSTRDYVLNTVRKLRVRVEAEGLEAGPVAIAQVEGRARVVVLAWSISLVFKSIHHCDACPHV